jgi:integrase
MSASASIVVREQREGPVYAAMFRYEGQLVKRRIGPAWLERVDGKWEPRRGRVQPGFYDERRAHVRAAEIVAGYIADAEDIDRVRREREQRGVTFREVANEYLRWLQEVKGAKPATLSNHRSVLAEPGESYKRGNGTINGHVMGALGDRPAAEITTREIETLLARVAKTAGPRTVNKYRAVIVAIFNYGMRESTFALPTNPAAGADKRREPKPGALVYYDVEEIEALARALEDGLQRGPRFSAVTDEERTRRRAEDLQDAEIVRVAAYAGLRQGELLALRWRDVDFSGHALTVARAMSAGIEGATKSGRVRRLPMPDQAAAALERLSRRQDYTGRDELVFCNLYGRPLDGSALRRRFKRARDAVGLRPLRFHDLRHTYGSLLAAHGVDLVTIQAAMGHSALSTTSRYLHAKPATEQAEIFTRAFEPSSVQTVPAEVER